MGAVLLGEQHIARVLDRFCNRALMLSSEMGVLTRQDFAGVGDVVAHHLRSGERDFRWGGSLLLLFGGAHGLDERSKVPARLSMSISYFWIEKSVWVFRSQRPKSCDESRNPAADKTP
jgi:hypothetical protein